VGEGVGEGVAGNGASPRSTYARFNPISLDSSPISFELPNPKPYPQHLILKIVDIIAHT
jgi:hypothetical protein